ncbi:MAG: tripartite tricarboxylate transporter TctB family protein [Rhodobacteraceae bacterium]|nr:tripartite tricarboxylate transporter TctB family protein [Paracoccaceae bacterium]
MRWKLEGTLAVAVLTVGVLLFFTAPNLVRGWAFSIPGTTDVALEPVFFPRLASLLLASSAVLVLATIPLRSGALPAVETDSGAYLRAGAGLAGILVYLISVVTFGFVVSTVVFITVASFIGGYRKLAIVIPVAIGVAVALRLVFRFGLHVGLPEGLLL